MYIYHTKKLLPKITLKSFLLDSTRFCPSTMGLNINKSKMKIVRHRVEGFLYLYTIQLENTKRKFKPKI